VVDENLKAAGVTRAQVQPSDQAGRRRAEPGFPGMPRRCRPSWPASCNCCRGASRTSSSFTCRAGTTAVSLKPAQPRRHTLTSLARRQMADRAATPGRPGLGIRPGEGAGESPVAELGTVFLGERHQRSAATVTPSQRMISPSPTARTCRRRGRRRRGGCCSSSSKTDATARSWFVRRDRHQPEASARNTVSFAGASGRL